MARAELYRAKCAFNLTEQDGAKTAALTETKSVPTSPNFLRSANINALNLNNKVNQNIQFFTKLSAKTIEDGTNQTGTIGSPAKVIRRKDKSPVRLLADKENDQQEKKEDSGEEKDTENEKEEVKPKDKPERIKVLLDLPSQDQRTSKSSEDLTRVEDDVNEKDVQYMKDVKDLREIFLGFKEGDLFRVLSKEWESWWAVRSLDSNRRVGLVQAQYLEKSDDGLPDDEESENMVSICCSLHSMSRNFSRRSEIVSTLPPKLSK
ncbi:Crk-like protein [Frankliniella fusca]|uniref:Crk-like protein n=1 Tax=Frankliniella fusca TaxID=407009 RepID=A0AAE1HMJ0_9NEOP|nr:Crk-like protein [Frankliniella fusca]